MDIELTKRFVDSFHEARRLTDMLLELPEGLTPRHIRVIDNIHALARQGRAVRVSDISDAMRSTRPSITRLVNDLQAKGIVKKTPDAEDKRVIRVELTHAGLEVYNIYCLRYHEWLAELLEPIPVEDAEAAIRAIHRASELMSANKSGPAEMI